MPRRRAITDAERAWIIRLLKTYPPKIVARMTDRPVRTIRQIARKEKDHERKF